MRAPVLIVLSMVATAAPAAAQPPSLSTVLERAAAYIADFQRQLASIVAEEQYVQDWRTTWAALMRQNGTAELGHRVLRSDLLLVRPGGDADWMEFRDVFDVDGRAVRERSERLEKMFLRPSTSTALQISRILTESARFNIGDVERNVNTPLFPLQFLEASNQPRFRFKRTGDRQPKTIDADASLASGAFRVSTEVWVIAYDERQSGTMIKTSQRRDLPSHGRFWIEPATGRVLMSELICETRDIRALIDVSFQSEPMLGLLVPIEMRERYDAKRSKSVVEGHATYGKFRQFTVNTDEKFLLKKQ
jgi:hypothetical protein